ncbi:MAG TPA: DNA helicase II [Chromatiaceae bacterium]|nr:DNA helicase II [Chromatiaceae bacterium]
MEDVSHILDGLNDAQREAITAPVGSLLVLAGAGSGKTRVLVHRIAWLLAVEGAMPWSILAVTFTNKAAREMKGRIEALIGQPLGGMWVGTFHGLAHRLLRSHWEEAGLPKNFQILDSDDQFRLIKRLLKQLEIDDSRWPPRQIMGFINARKDEGLRPEHLDDGGDFFQRQLIRVYTEYEQACERGGLVDFAELLLRAHELWLKRPDILQHYQQRFAHVLVDEFQDTNAIQYAWLRLLTGGRDNIFVVGDDDQSIYGWRGARVEHIRQFQKHYPEAKVIRLEQNYRSSGNILKAANALIEKNASRLGKNLWTEDGDGEPIRIYAAFNEIDEARFVVDRLRQSIEAGQRRADIAILYRSNAQSRLFEEALIQSAIPYRVYGGLRFFERAEVKDALAYLRLLANRHDDVGFERAVNMPPRGIGPRTLDGLRAHARDFGCSLWQAALELLEGGRMAARARNALRGFVDLIEATAEGMDELELHELMDTAIEASGLVAHFKKSRDGRGEDRIENLEELVNATRSFVSEDEETDDLSAFLTQAALDAGDKQAGASEDCVQLMTLHSAKGLEFPLVFIAGVEENLFPHRMSADDPERLEEERRLCYVGITRAMQQLYLTYAESRRMHGQEDYPMPSRFLRDIPAELVEEVRAVAQTRKPWHAGGATSVAEEASGFSLGQRVQHPKFGEGVVLNAEGQGKSARVQVNFEQAGSKWLVVAYANLAPC